MIEILDVSHMIITHVMITYMMITHVMIIHVTVMSRLCVFVKKVVIYDPTILLDRTIVGLFV